jgi:hypothetical protein
VVDRRPCLLSSGNSVFARARSTARVTKLSLDLNNMLLAQSTNGLSFIDKKFFNINVTAVPEPSTILLGLMGGVGMLVGGRRLRKAKTP